MKYYASSIDSSLWNNIKPSPVLCQISHHIPQYGKATFTSRANKSSNLSFTLEMMIQPGHTTPVSLISRAPLWRPGITDRNLLQFQFQKYQNLELNDRVPWIMLNELEMGMEPTFFYNDWNNPKDKIAVGLSPVNFSTKYHEFKKCMNGLLPYNLEDFSFVVFYYRKGSAMTEHSVSMLEKLSEYLKHDNQVAGIHIESFTDSYGGITQNKRIARKRASNLRRFFMKRGVPKSKIKIKMNAMKRFAAKNSLASERAKNRRVILRIRHHAED